ncbi:MAG: hypothetical protein IAF08_04800 [Rhizobacter sp.]|nr:hypothetical protein [Chlorobiales bacterium]
MEKINLKQAAKNAMEFFLEANAAVISTAKVVHGTAMLEEVKKEGGYWSITIGYDEQNELDMLSMRRRKFKEFRVDDETGEVVSMKIREVKSYDE